MHKRNSYVEKSAKAEPGLREYHNIHWEPTDVEKKRNFRRRKIKEALHIHGMVKRNGAMNQDNGRQLSRVCLDVIAKRTPPAENINIYTKVAIFTSI